MKKKYLLGILFSVFTLIFVSACNSPSNIKANFKQSSYTLSIGESVDFFDELTITGVDEGKISIESTNSNIIQNEQGIFKAINPGSAYILAKLGNDIVAQTKVQVRYKFSSPQNITVSETGVLTWDKSYLTDENGNLVNANSYNLSYGRVIDGEETAVNTTTTSTNSFKLPNTKGVYKISLQAISSSEKYDSSEIVVKNVNYGVMGKVENLALTNDNKTGNATLSWKAKENAVYDVFIEGLRVEENLEANSFDYDFSQHSNLSKVKIEIVAKSSQNDGALETTTTQNLVRLTTPTLSYSDGELALSNVANATNYVLKNFNDRNDVLSFDQTNNIIMEDYESDIYTFQAMAIGSVGDGLYLNSNYSSAITFAKLAQPQYSFAMTESGVKITFQPTPIEVVFNISYAGGEKDVSSSLTDEVSIEIDMSSLTAGEQEFTVQACPKSGTTFTDGNISTSNILKSDETTFTAIKTAEIGEIEHSINEGASTISFDKLDNVNFYQLYVNGELESEDYNEEDGKISFTIADLSQTTSQEGEYNFEVRAGLKDGENVLSTTSKRTKTVTVLDKTSKADEQINGYYSWNSIRGAIYRYEVYITDQYGNIENQTAVQSGRTENTTISEALPFGYYKIKVYVLSANDNMYLDADFEDKAQVHEDSFIVTEQIVAPKIALIEDNGKFKVQITISQYAGNYKIYIDGQYETEIELVSEIWSDQEDVIREVSLDETFENEKNYSLSVVASAGDLYNSQLHLDSQSSSITITRIAKASCDVEIKYDSYGRILNEYISSTIVANATEIKAYRGESTLAVEKQGNKYVVDANTDSFGDSFEISFESIAKEDQAGHYYLDGLKNKFSFERVASPYNVVYNNGELSFQNNDENVEKLLVYLTTYKGGSPSAYYTFEIDKTKTSENLQERVEGILNSTPAFKSAYNDMDYLEVCIYGFANSTKEGVRYIPSQQSNTVKIGDLNAVELSFDQPTKTLSWTGGTEGGRYDLYIGGVVAVENIDSHSITLSQIAGLDLSSEKQITIVSKHSAYFDSKQSNTIRIKQLPSVTTAVVGKNGSDFTLTLNFSANSAIESVQINGANATFTAGSNMASYVITTSGQQKVQLIAKTEMVDGVYYISSDLKTFTLQLLGTISLTKSGDTISWNNPSLNVIKRASVNPYTVQLTLTDGTTSATYMADSDEKEISINEIEELFKIDLNDDTNDFSISAKVVFNNAYSLNLAYTDAVGLYGESQSASTVTVYKLKSVGDIDVTVVDDTSATDNVSAKMDGRVNFTFEDKWSSFSNVKFVIKVGETELDISAKESTLTGYYKVSYSSNKWTLSIWTEHFAATSIPLSVRVASPGHVDSDEKAIRLTRYSKVGNVAISEDGILSITDAQTGANYAVTVSLGREKKTGTFIQSEISAIDFTTDEWLGGLGYGDYTVKVVAYDPNNEILPSVEEFDYSAHQYQGIVDASIDEEGKIIISVASDSYSGAIFTVKTSIEGKTYKRAFIPTLKTNQTDSDYYIYYLTMKEAVSLFEEALTADNIDIYRDYTVAFTVRGEGGVNSTWKEVLFTYSGDYDEEDLTPQFKRSDYDEDYIVFPISETVTTSSIYAKVSASYTIKGVDGRNLKTDVKKEISFSSLGTPLASIQGYWIESANGGRFSQTNNSVAGENATECYAVKLNDILAELEMGEYSIQSYRTGVDASGNYIQYSPISLSGYKLCTIYEEDEDDGEDPSNIAISSGYLLEWSYAKQDLNDKAQSASAYYVVVSDGANVKKFLTNLPVYDLRTCGLEKNKTYQVHVVAIGFDVAVLSSNKSNTIEVTQYDTPLTPTVENGVIGFDLAQTEGIEGTLYGDIFACFSGANAKTYEQILLETSSYSLPVTFSIEEIDSARIRIKFTSITDEGAEGKAYFLTVPALDLLLDREIDGKSYFDYLKEYKESVTDENVKAFIEKMLLSKRGIGTMINLFDDEGANIPKGLYEVSFVQIAKDNFVESPCSSSMRVYLSAGASIELNQETLGGKANQYTMTVTPNMTAVTNDGINYIQTTALSYRMLFRGKTNDLSYTIDFTYDLATNTWSGLFLDTDINSTEVGTILYTLELANAEGVKYYKVNMSLLRNVMELLLNEEGEIFDIDTDYQIDVFALANGDKGVLNGKSGKFTLTYQDLDVEDIRLENGVIILPTTTNGNLIVRYAYKITAGTTEIETISISKGENQIDLAYIIDGRSELEFVSFALQGNYTYNTMNVESKVYGIANPYKLSNPVLTSTNNNLKITYSENDLTSGATKSMNDYITYVVSNDQGGAHTSVTTTNNIDYQVGLYGEEKRASEFYVNLQGNSGQFACLSQEDEYFQESENYDYQLVLSSARGLLLKDDGTLYQIVFKSQSSTIAAKMLDYGQSDVTDNYLVERGSISFNLPLTYTSDIKDDDGNEAHVIYKVNLKYYDKQDNNNNSTPVETDTIYLTADYLVDGKLRLDGQLVNRDRAYVSFEVTALAGKAQVTHTETSVVTADNKFYTINESFTYSDGAYVLRSETLLTMTDTVETKFGHPVTPTQPKTTGTLTLANGQITFVTSALEVTDGEYVDGGTWNVLVLITDTSGAQVELTGEIMVSDQSEGRVAQFVPYDFEDKEELSTLKGSNFTISVMTYDENELLSKPLVITDVYKLPDLTGLYEIKVKEKVNDEGVVTGYTTYIDFSKYFQSVNVSSNNSFYAIQVLTKRIDGTTVSPVTLTNTNYTFDLNENMASIAVQVVDNQSYSTNNRIKLLNSDVLDVKIEKTEYVPIEILGVAQRIISWNNDMSGFEWQGGDESKSYEFFIKLVISGKTEMDITSYNYYLPQNMGTVSSFLIQAREKSLTNEFGEPTIYIFSESIEAKPEQLNHEVSLFAGGDGTKANPYLIQTVEQFNAISTRNTESVYFKLMDDLTITLGDDYNVISMFNGNLVGNGKTLTINASNMFDLSSEYTVSGIMSNQYKFTKFSSLFEIISPNASVSDLKVKYTISNNSLNSTYILYSPLAAFNYGQIDNVTILENTVNALGYATNGSGTNRVFISGIVGANYGAIISCKNNSAFSYTSTQGLGLVIGYSGIASFNDSSTFASLNYTGTILNCSVTGGCTITIQTNGLTVYVGGIAIKNGGSIIASLSEGTITTKASSGKSGAYYVGGLAVSNINGTIKYCYSKANITTGSGTATVGGSITQVVSGSINHVVDLTGKGIANSCTSSVSASDCYALAGTVPTYLQSATRYLTGAIDIAYSDVVSLRGISYNVNMALKSTDGVIYEVGISVS